MKAIDLTTRYLGIELRSPIVASASPLTGELETLRELEAAGVGAVVLPSLFAEQFGPHEPASLHFYNRGVETHLCFLADAKEAIGIPVIASINADSRGDGWVRQAALMESLGADALELNLYHVACDP